MTKKKSKKPNKKAAIKKAKTTTKEKKKLVKNAKKKSVKKTTKKPVEKRATKTSENFTSVNIYLIFNGNCEEAFDFYKSIFGGTFTYMGRFKDMPPIPGKTMSEQEGNRIMHVSLPISKETSLMGSDSSDEYGHATVIGTNFSVSVNAKSQAEADRIFNALAEGGRVNMPMEKTFWGAYFGMLVDKFGIQWMVNFDFNAK